MKVQLLLIFSVLIFIGCQSVPEISQEFDIQGSITEFGIYTMIRTQEHVSSDSISGKIGSSIHWVLLEPTETIPAVMGSSFGYELLLQGEFPLGTNVDLTTVVRHPEMTNPESGITTTKQSWPFSIPIGRPLHSGYTFDFDYEIVPGTWVLEQWLGGQLLVSKEFTVVLPSPEDVI